jgi:hypothetical protein
MADKEKDREKELEKRPSVAPEPADVRMFEFFVRHMSAESMPQIIELRQAYGQGGRTYSESTIDSKEFRANSPIPSHSDICELVNWFLDSAQHNCDELGRTTGYGFLFKNHQKSDKYYAVYYKKLSPKARHVEGDGEGDGLDDVVPDAKRRDSLLAYSLRHMEESDLNERWRQEQFAKSTGGILEHYQALAGMLMRQNLELMQEHRTMVKQTDEALSHKMERELAAEKEKFKMQMMSDGFNFLKGMVPVAVNQITGKQTIPTKETAESMAIRSFLDSLSKQQAVELFGEITDSGDMKGGGVFTPEQTKIFAGVAQCDMEPAALEQLFEGPLAVQGDQLTRAQTILSPQQLMPLMTLIMTMKKKQLEG